MGAPAVTVWFVIPCSADKADTDGAAVPASDLYATSSQFRYALAKVTEEAALTAAQYGNPARVLILSALHGLISPDEPIAPYDVRIGRPGCITVDQLAAQAQALGIGWTGDDCTAEVYGLLPADYRNALHEALNTLDIPLQDVYEAAPGIGYMRGVLARIGN